MKRVLFIGMAFYKYEKRIIQLLTGMGYQVDYYIDRKDFFRDHCHFIHITPEEKEKMIAYYQRKILSKLRGKKYDCVFVIVGRYLNDFFLDTLRNQNPDAVFILYLWDDVRRVQNFQRAKKYYDRIFSFDPVDVQNEGFTFLPLFFEEEVMNGKTDGFKNDVYSVMYLHTDREMIAKAIIDGNPGIRSEIIFKCSLGKAVKTRVFRKDQTRGITYQRRSVSEAGLLSGMLSAKAILDVQFPSQVGLTMRTFDTLSVGRKLITTNASIQYYDFFDEQNITLLNREKPTVSKEFLDSPYRPVDKSIVEKYSLENWLKVIFEEKRLSYLRENNPYGL
jgi:hypothetical protein